jgi:hypothetical protein
MIETTPFEFKCDEVHPGSLSNEYLFDFMKNFIEERKEK